jgi:D-beta-D-heptose 7-phosphate kinase / D-beta-D-heptose 1-phosphate adenosyltransferase
MTARALHTAGSMAARRMAAAPIVVIGDVMLDIDLVGKSVRQSPEAPVPVLHDLTERRRPGGAALAALLAARGSHPVVLIAPFADDDAANDIRELLGEQVEVVALPWNGTTPVKTRLRAGDHPVARLDRGGSPGLILDVPDRAASALAEAAAVLVSDYGVGVTIDPRIRTLVAAATDRVPVVWDPHPRGAPAVAGTSVVIPNERELFGLIEVDLVSSLDGVHRAAASLRDRWDVRAVCVTLGSRGALLSMDGDGVDGDGVPGDQLRLLAGTPVVGSDTCGAGDSFAAALVVAMADGAAADVAITHAVATAGRFVAGGGAATFDPRRPPAPVTEDALDARLAAIRRAGGVVVATGGCFDLLHAGHVATLDAARALGDFLVVCLNSDESVRRLKGPERPLQTAAERSLVLSAMQSVDAVAVFTEDTPVELLRRIRPDVWAKGGDYSGKTLPETAVLAEWGGQVVTMPYVAGISTTGIVARAVRSAAG